MNGQRRKFPLFAALSALALQLACGGGNSSSPIVPSSTIPGTVTQAATIQHVVIVVEENHSYESVIGSPDMPFLNGLATQYGLATAYFANGHPSIGNYFMLTTGTLASTQDTFSGTVSSDNLARILAAAGKSWKVYAEGLPSTGYLGNDTGGYVKHHNPFAYFTDVINDPVQAANIVPFSQFASDLANGLPNLAFIVPNNADNGHDGSLAVADSWLHTNIDPLLANAAFQQSGVLIITYDEGDQSDIAMGGGHIATVVAGNRVKPGFRFTTTIQHQSTLRFILEAMGISRFPGAAAGAPSMTEFLQ